MTFAADARRFISKMQPEGAGVVKLFAAYKPREKGIVEGADGVGAKAILNRHVGSFSY